VCEQEGEDLEEFEEVSKGKETCKNYTDDEEIKIQQIKLYYKNFPWLDEELHFEEQGDLMLKQKNSINQWVSKINILVNDRTLFELVKLGFYSTAGAIEYLSSSWFGLKLNGYEACLRSNPEIEELLKILKIKHLSSLQDVTPEQKLLGICLFSVLTIH